MPYRGHKIVLVTPAGRKRYMELLFPQILKYQHAGVVDEYHFWKNTVNTDDIAFMTQTARLHPDFVRIAELPRKVPVNGNLSIYDFFKRCIETNTVYVRFDDDIVVLDTVDAFKKFLDFRIDNNKYFMVYANILNNAMCTYILQHNGRLSTDKGIAQYLCMDEVGWKSGEFAAGVHDQVLKQLELDGLSHFRYPGSWPLLQHERVSINCLSWLGENLNAACKGLVGEDEEDEISVQIPKKKGLFNVIFGEYCVVHYAFFTQRLYLDEHGYEDKYRQLQLKSI